MMDVKTLFLLLLFCSVAHSVKHYLRFFLTGSYGVPDFPEFVAAAMVDGVDFGYCDSNINRAKAKPDWVTELLKDEPAHLEWYSVWCLKDMHLFRESIEGLMQRLNQSGGSHILQRMNGCEWDDETGKINGFVQYGYDGEDFIALDLQTLTWIAPSSLAFITKMRWDTEKVRLQHLKHFYTADCPSLVKKYLHYGRLSLQRTELPSVSLLQKTSSSPITCHATGFYPNNAVLFWRKDGEELQEGVDHGDILPNPDGTFQMSVDLTLPSESSSDWGRYECVFQLSGVKEDMVTKLDKAAIRSNEDSPSVPSAGPVVGVAVGLLLLLSVCIVGFLIWRKKHNRCQQNNTLTGVPSQSEEVVELQ